MERKKYTSIDQYISDFPIEIQTKLELMRKTIKEVALKSTETISYNMPAFKKEKILVYYAAFKNHIGLYPASDAINYFKEQLKDYKTSKGAIQFPLDKPLPIELIKKIVKYREDNIKGD